MSKKPAKPSHATSGTHKTGKKKPARPQRPQRPHSHATAKKKKPAKAQPPQRPQGATGPLGGAGGSGSVRGLALGEALACCAAEALAAQLRLRGFPVTDRDVAELYELTDGAGDDGATIEATLRAAAEHGLAGIRPVSFGEVTPGGSLETDRVNRAGRVLGVALPARHTVADDGSGWWSWGRRWPLSSFPRAVVEETWTVSWPYD